MTNVFHEPANKATAISRRHGLMGETLQAIFETPPANNFRNVREPSPAMFKTDTAGSKEVSSAFNHE